MLSLMAIGMYIIIFLAFFIIVREMVIKQKKKNQIWAVCLGASAVIFSYGLGILAINMTIKHFVLNGIITVLERKLLSSYISFYILMTTGWCILCLWKRIVEKEVVKHTSVLLFFIAGQTAVWLGYIQGMTEREGKVVYGFHGGFLIGSAADILFFLIIFQKIQKENLLRQLWETQTLRDLRHRHYEDEMKNRTEMQNLKRELLAQSKILSGFLQDSDKKEEARDYLSRLTGKMKGINTVEYCPISVVNAILTEKAKVCKERDIDFHIDVQIQEERNIKSIHLCSVFANLLDNAIEACSLIQENEKRVIQLHAAHKADYICVKVENTYNVKIKNEKKPGRGYGSLILKEIAGCYNGDYQVKEDSGIYKAFISLQIQNEIK